MVTHWIRGQVLILFVKAIICLSNKFITSLSKLNKSYDSTVETFGPDFKKTLQLSVET